MNDEYHEFAFDYISHGENRLALEALLDYIYEYDVDISQSEFDEMMELVEFFQADMSKLMYLQGLVKKV